MSRDSRSDFILRDVFWSFKTKYDSKAIFSDAIKLYQIEILGKDTWLPHIIVIDAPVLSLLIKMEWNYPPDDQIILTLTADNNRNFSSLEIMFKLNNLILDLDLGDFCFFEGLSPCNGTNDYLVRLGS